MCCYPGCTDRELQCGINEFCCGEVGSPYQNESACLPITAGGSVAEGGECFDMSSSPWCRACLSSSDCSSGYVTGYNTSPGINGGLPFQEQEFCSPIANGIAICSITCNPTNIDSQCPRGWSCRAAYPPCFQDADCNGLECVGEDTSVNPPRSGRCKCGQNGVASAVCPIAYALLDAAVANPRCRDPSGTGSGDMLCNAAFNCMPPALRVNPDTSTNYPATCGF